MNVATFILAHHPSNSRVFVECGRVRGKMKVVNVGFVNGNVVELAAIRNALKYADKMV